MALFIIFELFSLLWRLPSQVKHLALVIHIGFFLEFVLFREI